MARAPRQARGKCLSPGWATDRVHTFVRAERDNVEKALLDNTVGEGPLMRNSAFLPSFHEPCYLYVRIFGAESFMYFPMLCV